MKYKILMVVNLFIFLISAHASGQSLLEPAVRGNINVMHSSFVSGGFSAGLAGTGAHPQDLVKDYESFVSSIENGRREVSGIMNDIGLRIDSFLNECGQEKKYSACTDKSCRTSALEQLLKCGVSRSQVDEITSQISQMRDLQDKLNAGDIDLSIGMKANSVNVRALGIQMAATLVLTGQALFFPVVSPYDPQDKLTGAEKRAIVVVGLKSAWARTSELLGCDGSAIDPEFASFESTPSFIDTACKLSKVGKEKGSVLAADFIAIYEPNVNWDIYTNFKRN